MIIRFSRSSALLLAGGLVAMFAACTVTTQSGPTAPSPNADDGITYRSEVKPVTRVEDAKPRVFIPPFEDCREALPGEAAGTKNGKVCTNVSISGATEAGRSFDKYASCGVVKTQRPYYPRDPAKMPSANDPRLQDATYVAETTWAKDQVAASGCACCHDSRISGPSQWDINAGGTWLDTLSDSGLALFLGYADSSVLGAYPAAENHGFDRNTLGIPTTDAARMTALLKAELERRGITEEQARKVPPFGGPIYANSVRPPTACGAGEGIAPDGRVLFKGGAARYVYVLDVGSKNPGVPPNLDRPAGMQWRLDVLPSADALPSGLMYAKTPAGSYQDFPISTPAAALTKGKPYQLYVLLDVGIPLANCTFTFGDEVAQPATPDAGASDSGASDASSSSSSGGMSDSGSGDGGGVAAFGATCSDDANCQGPTDYCVKAPGAPTGYCSRKGCKEDASICPSGWACFDLGMFQPGLPSICRKP
jgi:hypothetical protein